MPRSFDSDDQNPVLRFTENVECPNCSDVFEAEFTDPAQSLSVTDMVEPPTGRHHCSFCGWVWSSELTGWMFYTEAG